MRLLRDLNIVCAGAPGERQEAQCAVGWGLGSGDGQRAGADGSKQFRLWISSLRRSQRKRWWWSSDDAVESLHGVERAP